MSKKTRDSHLLKIVDSIANEDQALQVLVLLEQRFGWRSRVLTRQDILNEINTFLTEDASPLDQHTKDKLVHEVLGNSYFRNFSELAREDREELTEAICDALSRLFPDSLSDQDLANPSDLPEGQEE